MGRRGDADLFFRELTQGSATRTAEADESAEWDEAEEFYASLAGVPRAVADKSPGSKAASIRAISRSAHRL